MDWFTISLTHNPPYMPDSHLINDYQPLDHRLISCTISPYSAA